MYDMLDLELLMGTIFEHIEDIARRYPLYEHRRKEFAGTGPIPFRLSPEPLILTKDQFRDIKRIGVEVVSYFWAAQELYLTDPRAQMLLDKDIPEELCGKKKFNFLFLRPDLILTDRGFKLCEIETSPFGLALADILNRAYRSANMETAVETEKLRNYLQLHTPRQGLVVDSSKTKAFRGQMRYLAEKLLSHATRRKWSVADVSDSLRTDESIWRAFYLGDFNQDMSVKQFMLNRLTKLDTTHHVPGLFPQMEEKVLLSLIWDKRFKAYFRKRLGAPSVEFLQGLIPHTWVLGHEEHFLHDLPGKTVSTLALAGLGKHERTYVLKASGFGKSPSWGEGVTFLHKISGTRAASTIRDALDSTGHFVVQKFREGVKLKTSYMEHGMIIPFEGRLRLTPYFDTDKGDLLTMKATLRANTELIHASTDSINTAVAVA